MIFVFVIDTSPSMGKPAFPSSSTAGTERGSSSSSMTSSISGSSSSSETNSLSRLDVAKMVVEDFHRQWRKLRQKQMQSLQQSQQAAGASNFLGPLGQLPTATTTSSTSILHQLPDQFLLLSTSRQHSDRTATCAGGGRLLVGYYHPHQHQQQQGTSPSVSTTSEVSTPGGVTGSETSSVDIATIAMETFHRELKQLKVATIPSTNNEASSSSSNNNSSNNNSNENNSVPTVPPTSWNEEWGGAAGLNIALSTGLELISRYRLQHKHTEHFGMGRLPNTAINVILPSSDVSSSHIPLSISQQQQLQQPQNPNTMMIGAASSALQPACLIVLTDGACLRNSEKQGGGPIQLHYGLQPLREFYQEPFRWDQRIFIQAIGVNSTATTSTQYLHPQLRTLCDVTGGAHFIVRLNHQHQHLNFNNGIHTSNEAMLRCICPNMPNELPLPDPLYTHIQRNNDNYTPLQQQYKPILLNSNNNTNPYCFMNGGPICSFQCLEMEEPSNKKGNVIHRAMLLYIGAAATTTTTMTMTTDPYLQQPMSNTNTNTTTATTTTILSPPLYCLPESYFPNKALDTLPPRSAQPKLFYSKFPMNLGMKSFVPLQFIQQQLYRLDQLHMAIHNLKHTPQQQRDANSIPPVRLLHRDVYICDWIDNEGDSHHNKKNSNGKASGVNPFHVSSSKFSNPNNIEYFPVLVPGAGRPSLSETGENYLNIGILHHPVSTDFGASAIGNQYTTLTLLPPDPQILVPLLIRAAEMEHRAWKRAIERSNMAASASSNTSSSSSQPPVVKVNATLDEQWKSEFRAYLFRVPVYYHNSIKRALRPILPQSVHVTLLQTESFELITAQCYSKVCHQKIRNGELISREQNERMERQEAMIRFNSKVGLSSSSGSNANNAISMDTSATSTGVKDDSSNDHNNIHNPQQQQIRSNYGHYDPRFNIDTYLASLRNIPAPWRLPISRQSREEPKDNRDTMSNMRKKQRRTMPCAVDVLGDLPAKGLLAFYESRRRWVFGGPGLSVRGLHAEGVPNDGSNSQHCGSSVFVNTKSAKAQNNKYECLLTIGGVGASILNQTCTTKMGEYRERLLFNRSPVVGYGSNDAAGVSATTAIDGSPTWSVDDDAMPLTFFDPKTGEFTDSAQARVRSKLMVNFGNPYREKRADSLIPEKYLSQSPSMLRSGDFGSTSSDRPTSPPHDSFDSVEEGEAIFVLNSPSRKSPKREESDSPSTLSSLPVKRQRSDSDDKTIESLDSTSASDSSVSKKPMSPSTPPPPPPRPPLPKRPSTKVGIAANSKQPPPPPAPPARPKPGTVPPPPPPPTTLGAPPTLQVKKSQPLPPAKTQRPPPKPPKLDSKESLQSSTPKLTPIEDFTTDDTLGRPTLPKITSSTTEIPTGTNIEVEIQSTESKVLTRKDSDDVAHDTNTKDTATLPGSSGLPPIMSQQQQHQQQQQEQFAIASTDQPVLILDNEHVKPNVELLQGWICVWSKSKQRWYFFDTKTNHSVWNWPP